MTKVINERSTSAHLTHTPMEHRASHKGMAHFAGTGPNGRTCRECALWDYRSSTYSLGSGRLTNERCMKFTTLSRGQKGQRVPEDAMACKYFELNPTAPGKYNK
jgi:hypothetical protein